MSEKIIIPISIIIAGAIIAAAVVFSGNRQVVVQEPVAQPQQEQPQANPDIRKVSDATDHIFGNPNADLFIVEYSDIECPFCKRYNEEVLGRLKSEYQDNDRIAFVFRHFPLDAPFTRELHPNATEEAVAAECVADLAGDDAFFTFVGSLFADTTTANLSGEAFVTKLSDLAVAAGADATAFENCYAEDDQTKVAADFNDGVENGVQGTPTVFVQDSDGTSYLAVADYTVLKQAIEVFLSENASE